MTYDGKRVASWSSEIQGTAGPIILFPGAMNVAAGSPNEIFLATGIISQIEVSTDVDVDIRLYDYHDADGRSLRDATTGIRSKVVVTGGAAVKPAGAERYDCYTIGDAAAGLGFNATNRRGDFEILSPGRRLEGNWQFLAGMAIELVLAASSVSTLAVTVSYYPYSSGGRKLHEASKTQFDTSYTWVPQGP